ncbi:hypothetical protein [Sewage-associated circular DNA virus-8]|uniref:Uncharacterized protein n=1 Tax=Sewage-associated circular DNA virus-8 TaxID=1519397 RepID=A0A075J472_9VIRU|nr:hypothetical protein [Sewage-associated circular DNA virus-8]
MSCNSTLQVLFQPGILRGSSPIFSIDTLNTFDPLLTELVPSFISANRAARSPLGSRAVTFFGAKTKNFSLYARLELFLNVTWQLESITTIFKPSLWKSTPESYPGTEDDGSVRFLHKIEAASLNEFGVNAKGTPKYSTFCLLSNTLPPNSGVPPNHRLETTFFVYLPVTSPGANNRLIASFMAGFNLTTFFRFCLRTFPRRTLPA